MSVPLEYLEVARRAWAAYNDGDEEAFAACVTPDWREYDGDAPVTGLKEAVELMRLHRGAFPDKHTEMLHLFGDGDLVTTYTLTTATHLGRYEDLEPTGRKVRMYQINIHRIVDGRIAETWLAVSEPGGFYTQIVAWLGSGG